MVEDKMREGAAKKVSSSVLKTNVPVRRRDSTQVEGPKILQDKIIFKGS
jgi:hypothetical protein